MMSRRTFLKLSAIVIAIATVNPTLALFESIVEIEYAWYGMPYSATIIRRGHGGRRIFLR